MPSHVQNPPTHTEGSRRWSARTLELCLEWQSASTDSDRNRVLGELWVLINAILARYIRLHSRSLGMIDAEDVRDIASEKAMAFVHNLRNDGRDMGDMHVEQITTYVSVLARNGLVDTLRKRGRHGVAPEDTPEKNTAVAPESDGAEITVRHEQFLRAICDCVGRLSPRAQSAWFMRAFLDMSSKEIAVHPDVGMTVTAVDMMLSRARRALRDCMDRKGLSADDAPPGTFVALWELLSKRTTATDQGG